MLARVILAASLLAPFAAAGTLRVPKDFSTIQQAVDAAGYGDKILVSKGVYEAPIVVDGHSNVQIRGLGHPLVKATGHDTGISVNASHSILIIGFDVEGADIAGILVTDSGGIGVERCRITGATSASAWPVAGIQFAGGSVLHAHRNHIEQVVVGVRFYGEGGPEADHCTVTRNVIHDVWHAAVELRGEQNGVYRNAFRDGDVGLFVDASHSHVGRNSVRDASTGIEVFGGDDLHLERNRVRDASIRGVRVAAAATGVTLFRDKIVASGSEASLLVEADGTISTAARILQARGVGVQLTGEDCTLNDARISKPQAHGVVLEGAGHTVANLRVTGAGAMGVRVLGDENVLIDCKASDVSTIGFFVEGDGNTLAACTSLDAGEYDVSKGGLENSYAPDCKFTTGTSP